MILLKLAAYLWGAFFIVLFFVMMTKIVRELLVNIHSPIVCWFEGHGWCGAGWSNHWSDAHKVPEDHILDHWHCWKCNGYTSKLRYYKDPYPGDPDA